MMHTQKHTCIVYTQKLWAEVDWGSFNMVFYTACIVNSWDSVAMGQEKKLER